MNPLDERCPSAVDVLLAGDGELSPEACDRIAAHLARCLRCRETQAQADTLTHAYAAAVDATLPTRPSADREARFLARLHAQRQHVALPNTWPMRHVCAAAAAIVLLVVGLTLSRETVRADALLDAAIREQSATADMVQRVGIRVTPEVSPFASLGTQPVSWVGELVGGTMLSSGPLEGNARTTSLVQMLDAHQLDLRRPFDARRLRSWHASLRGQRDEVRRVGDQWIVHTRPVGGAIRALEVTLQQDSHHIVRVIIVVDHVGRVEIEELSQHTRRSADASPVPPVPSLPTNATAREPRDIEPAVRIPAETIPDAALARWRDRRFGPRPERDAFLPALQTRIQRVTHHLKALQDLARRYPVTRPLSHREQATVQARADVHVAAVRAALHDLADQRRTLFGSVDRCTADQPPPATEWRRDVEAGLDQVAILDAQVRALLQHDDLPATAEAEVGGAIDALWRQFICPAGPR